MQAGTRLAKRDVAYSKNTHRFVMASQAAAPEALACAQGVK
jgi:hypothetical protein